MQNDPSLETYAGKILDLKTLIDYHKGSIVSREILKKEKGTVTIFSFDQGQGLSEHTAPFDAMVQILEGEAVITISGEPHAVEAGQTIIMPANKPHAVSAEKPFKMILAMIRG
jgi:quercetin dioxygenase-like cupin family protein